MTDQSKNDQDSNSPNRGDNSSLSDDNHRNNNEAHRSNVNGKTHKKKRSPLGILLRFLLIILLSILLALAVTVGVAAVDSSDPLDYMPGEVTACLQVHSLQGLIEQMLDLRAADIMLASQEWGEIRQQLVELRGLELWDKGWFQYLIRFPMVITLYSDEQLLIAGDLGIRSAPLRLGKPLLKIIPIPLEGLGVENHNGFTLLSYAQPVNPEEPQLESEPIFIALKGNLFFLSLNRDLLVQSLNRTKPAISQYPSLSEALNQRSREDLRILIKTSNILEEMENTAQLPSEILKELAFPDYAALDISLNNQEIYLSLDLPIESDHQGLKELIGRRSGAPAILSDLPGDVEYATILSLGSPQELMSQLESLLSPEIIEKIGQAEQASQLALGMGLNELLYSWIDDEWGVFGLSHYPEPLFFLRVKDEKIRQNVFQSLFSNFFIDQEDSMLVGDQRVNQIQLPWFIQGLLQAFKVDLPEPYYLVHRDFIYFSVSAEGLAHSVEQTRSGELLIKSPQWEEQSGRISSSASIQLFYSLNRSLPFFLQGSGAATDTLKLYNKGMGTMQFMGDRILLSLSAQHTQDQPLQVYPGFPVERNHRINGGVIPIQYESGDIRLYWLEGEKRLVEYQPSSGNIQTAELDDQAWLIPHPQTDSLWAVSQRGAVYQYSQNLELQEGYPLLTGLRLSTLPVAWEEGLYLCDKNDNSLILLNQGELQHLGEYPSPLLSPPSLSENGMISLYPKSFIGQLHLLSSQGIPMEGWPVPARGISYGSPFFIPRGESYMVGFLTQAGELTIYSNRGEILHEIELEGVFYQTPLWSSQISALFILAEDGTVYRWSLDGELKSTVVEGVGSKDSILQLMDIQKDGLPEIFIARGGGILPALDHELNPLAGFPISGGQEPAIADMNNDSTLEIITPGYDKSLRAYSLR